jgi:hypothetical protein
VGQEVIFMTVWERQAEIYKKHHLMPLDDFIFQSRTGDGENTDDYACIGATTWMLVRAAIALQDGKNVILTFLEGNQQFRISCLQKARTYSGLSTLSAGNMKIGFVAGNWIMAGVEKVTPKDMAVTNIVVFDDEEWKKRTIRRAKGPFEMWQITKKTEDGRAFAYAEDEECLFELSGDSIPIDPLDVKVIV